MQWKTVDRITTPAPIVVTGDEDGASATEDAQASSPVLKWTDKPLLVFVQSEDHCPETEKFETVALKNEKLALGVRAFHCVRMTDKQIEEDELFADQGKTLPRVLLIDPVKMKTKVVEAKNLTATKLFKEMKRVSGRFWKEKLDKVVDKHLKLLTEQDRLVKAGTTLDGQQERAKDDKRKLEKIEKEREEIREGLKAVTEQQAELWKLTPKNKAKKA